MSSLPFDIICQNILGVEISAINMHMALDAIRYWVEHKDHQYICVAPAHSVMDAYYSVELRVVMNASGLVTPDGMGIVWLLNLHGHRNVYRVYGPDLVRATCAMGSDHGYRHFFLGGNDGVVGQMTSRLLSIVPSLQVAGMYTPSFDLDDQREDDRIVNVINSSQADIVWIGLGSPKQEIWMAEHLRRIKAPIMIGVGAAFDFIAGTKPQAPRWIQRAGLEWLFRLFNEPLRLWPRYRQYPKFVLLALAQLIGLTKYPIED